MKLEQEDADQFINKTNNLLEVYCTEIENLSINPKLKKHVNAAIKAIQSIKGNASFLELHNIEVLAQANSNLLSNVRDKKISFTLSSTKVIALSIKAIIDQLIKIKKSGKEASKDYDKLLDNFNKLNAGDESISVRLSKEKIDDILQTFKKTTESENNFENDKPIDTNSEASITIQIIEQEDSQKEIEEHHETEKETTLNSDLNEIESQENQTSDENNEQEINKEASNKMKYVAVEDNNIIVKLENKLSIENLHTLHNEIQETNISDKNIEVKTSGLDKPSTSLLQFLLCLHNSKTYKSISYPEPSKAIQAECHLLFNDKSFI